MKIYFSTSYSRLTPDIKENCSLIVDEIKKLGHSFISEPRFTRGNSFYKKIKKNQALKGQAEITRDKKLSDVSIFEVTNPNVSIGQEIAYALLINKPVILLYYGDEEPHILRDFSNETLFIHSYTRSNVKKIIKTCFDYIQEIKEIRFNMLIPHDLNQYLNTISRQQNVHKSTLVRNLIREDMKKNQNY